MASILHESCFMRGRDKLLSIREDSFHPHNISQKASAIFLGPHNNLRIDLPLRDILQQPEHLGVV